MTIKLLTQDLTVTIPEANIGKVDGLDAMYLDGLLTNEGYDNALLALANAADSTTD